MLLSIISVAVTGANAWGAQGHELVGSIAQQFLTPQAIRGLSSLYPNQDGNLKSLTNWADSIKSNVRYAYANPYHFVNPVHINGKVPICEYVDERDCKDRKCAVGAIANYTMQATCDQPIPVREEAIKFLAHFVGDVSQPLHACGRERGGNDVRVKFDGRTKKLHQIWDTDILVKRVNNDFKGALNNYESFLVNSIRTGAFASIKEDWISKADILELSPNKNSKMAIDWIKDSNGFNCKTVWAQYDLDNTVDFGEDYYLENYRLVDLQLAKGAYRLANLINRLFEC
jgi:hypothetical protein